MKMKLSHSRILFFLLLLTAISCRDDMDMKLEEIEGEMTAGQATIYSAGPDAFTFPLSNLMGNAVGKHFEADGVFGQHFVTAPAEQFDGLGPLFNQNSCESCHVRNGRGIIPEYEGDKARGLLLRMSLPGKNQQGGNVPVPGYGTQFQNKAVFSGKAEGTITYSEKSKIIEFLDGSRRDLYHREYHIKDPYKPLPTELQLSPRIPPPVHGLGLLETIDETEILAAADRQDLDGDGISGKANMVWDILKQEKSLGRFGWKAGQPTAAQQAAAAAHEDMGLTNFYFTEESCVGQDNCTPGIKDSLDIEKETVDLMAFYFQTLAVPAARNVDDPEVIAGRAVFLELGCQSCHTPSWTTGQHEIEALSNQKIWPYTDLLLHDMGKGLADGRGEFEANGREWRTPPLWGIGLTQIVNSKATFLHDGRANTLEEAILWHGGEAEDAKTQYTQLNAEDREALLAFLNAI